MKIGLYPFLASVLIAMIVVSQLFKEEINASFSGVLLALLSIVLGAGFVLVALWDCGFLGKKKEK